MRVIDASVTIKWIKTNEEGVEQALHIYDEHVDGKEQIIIPQFLFIEIANFLSTKPTVLPEDILSSLSLLFTSSFIIHQVTENELIEAAQLAKEYKTSAYDMLYAVVAKANHATLITADQNFIKKVPFPFVKLLERSVRNERVTYS